VPASKPRDFTGDHSSQTASERRQVAAVGPVRGEARVRNRPDNRNASRMDGLVHNARRLDAPARNEELMPADTLCWATIGSKDSRALDPAFCVNLSQSFDGHAPPARDLGVWTPTARSWQCWRATLRAACDCHHVSMLEDGIDWRGTEGARRQYSAASG
jgi:hypothetical protein